MVCELQDKKPLVYSLIKKHLKDKILVFLSSCKQVSLETGMVYFTQIYIIETCELLKLSQDIIKTESSVQKSYKNSAAATEI